jgi:opacity protein-like surface antigen
MMRRFAALVAALAVTLLLAAPAFAADLTNPVPISSDDASLQGSADDCAEFNVQEGQVAWHFVLNQSDTNDQTLTATFENAGTITVSNYKWLDTYVLHYVIYTGSPDTLLSASTSGESGNLQLSHICNGGPPPDVPEAPASVLLILTSGLAGLAFVGWRMRRSQVVV